MDQRKYKKLKVLHLVKTARGGNWAMRQMQELKRYNVSVHVALPGKGPLLKSCVENGINIHLTKTHFSISKPWLNLIRINNIRRVVREVKPDLIHSHFVGTTLNMRFALRGYYTKPRIFQVPGPLHLEQSLFRLGEIATAGNEDYWIGACNDTMQKYLDTGISKSRVFMVHYGWDLASFLCHQSKGRLRRLLKIGNDTPLVGMVAFMYPPKKIMGKVRGIKGHEDLIDAVAIAAKTITDLRVVFIGGQWGQDSSYENKIKEYADRTIPGRAFFLGTRSDVPQLYNDFDIAIHPSHSENLGGALESLAAGIPTIATNVGGFTDIVIPGRTGFLVSPRKPSELARTMVHVFNNKKEASVLALNGRRLVIDKCNVKTTTEKIHNIYRKLIF